MLVVANRNRKRSRVKKGRSGRAGNKAGTRIPEKTTEREINRTQQHHLVLNGHSRIYIIVAHSRSHHNREFERIHRDSLDLPRLIKHGSNLQARSVTMCIVFRIAFKFITFGAYDKPAHVYGANAHQHIGVPLPFLNHVATVTTPK